MADFDPVNGHPNPFMPLRKRQAFRFSDAQQPFVETITASSLAGDVYLHDEVTALPSCVPGHAIRATQEMGGRCQAPGRRNRARGVCNATLCRECSQVRCELDKRILCGQHAQEVNGYLLCPNHSFLRAVVLSFAEPGPLAFQSSTTATLQAGESSRTENVRQSAC